MLGKLSSYYGSCKLKCLFLYVSAFDGSIYRMNLIKFYIKLRNVFHLVLISAGYAAFTRKPNNRQAILFDQSKIYSSKGRMVWGQSWSL